MGSAGWSNKWLSAANSLRHAHYWEVMNEVGSLPPEGAGGASNFLKFHSKGEYLQSISLSPCLSLFSSVQFSHSVVSESLQLQDCNMSGFPVHDRLLELIQTHIHWVGDSIRHLILCCPLLLLPSSFSAWGSFQMSQFFASGSQFWSFTLSISPAKQYSGLISFRSDWFDILAVQGTLKNLLQHHSSKTPILHHSTFHKSLTFASTHDYWKHHSLD